MEPPRDDDDCYALRQAAPPRPPAPDASGIAPDVSAAELGRSTAEERAAWREEQEERAWEAVARTPAPPILCAGTFGFPFRIASLPSLVTLSAVSILAIAVLRFGLLSARHGAEMSAAGPLALGAGLLAVGAVAGFICLAAVAIYGVTILHETAAGAEVVEDWPNLLGMESGSAILYAVAALGLAALPAWLAAGAAAVVGIPRPVVFSLTILVLFSPFLLSALEARSPFNVVSPAIWRTLTHAFRAWCWYYLLVSALAIAIALLVALADLCSAVFGVIVAGFLLAAGSMIYFRLLGRLAWFCSGRWAWADEPRRMGEEEEKEAEDGEAEA